MNADLSDYLMRAEHAALHSPGIETALCHAAFERIQTISIIGAGTMGRGIALCCAQAGYRVQLFDQAESSLLQAKHWVHETMQRMQDKGQIDADAKHALLNRIAFMNALHALRNADLFIEAVVEDRATKEAVLQQLDHLADAKALIASNTSTLDLNLMAQTLRPARRALFLGLHFFSPAHVMRLLEVVRTDALAPDSLATALLFAIRLNKCPVVAGVCDGFIGNRMLEAYTRQAGYLLEEGCMPEQVDAAIEQFGFAMGPFRMSDLAGNDISWAIRARRRQERPNVYFSPIPDLLCEAGRFGQKTLSGWYDYPKGPRQPCASPQVHSLIEHACAQMHLPRRSIPPQEIIERLLFALINEGAHVLEEGIAARASDIDLVYLNGYGFPRTQGGPMYWANHYGLTQVLQGIRRYSERARPGQHWNIAPLLLDLVQAGMTFNDIELIRAK